MITEQIQEQIKDAMRAKDSVRLTTLRGTLSAFTNESVALKRTPQDKLSDAEALTVIRRLVKQRKDSIEQFEKGGRADLAEAEKAELTILEEFLPAQMSEAQIREIALKKKEEMESADGFDKLTAGKAMAGKLMGAIIKEAQGNADSAVVKKIVEEILG